MSDSVDLIPIGAYRGRGRRAKCYGTYLLGKSLVFFFSNAFIAIVDESEIWLLSCLVFSLDFKRVTIPMRKCIKLYVKLEQDFLMRILQDFMNSSKQKSRALRIPVTK